MYEELTHICSKYDLIKKTIELAKQEIYYFKEENPEEFEEYFSQFNLQDKLPEDFSNVKFEVYRIGYEIRTAQSNIEALSVALDMMHNETDGCVQMCRYYCFYDDNGNYFDDVMEYQN